MAMRTFSFRMEADLLDLAAREAAIRGISLAEFVRSAVLVRTTYSAARREDVSEAFRDLYEAADRLVVATEG